MNRTAVPALPNAKQQGSISAMKNDDQSWWRHGIFYQVYPRSFQDSDGDGVGDLKGITERLPYIASLGVDAVWLSPIFTSPMADFGYDVADYIGIDPLFGTMARARRSRNGLSSSTIRSERSARSISSAVAAVKSLIPVVNGSIDMARQIGAAKAAKGMSRRGDLPLLNG